MLTIETEGRYRNKVTLTQGDSARNKVVSLTDDDVAVLTIKRDINDADVVLQLNMDSDGQFVFRPDDTAELECGRYCYDVQVTLSTGNVYTVIPPAQFVLEKGVT